MWQYDKIRYTKCDTIGFIEYLSSESTEILGNTRDSGNNVKCRAKRVERALNIKREYVCISFLFYCDFHNGQIKLKVW